MAAPKLYDWQVPPQATDPNRRLKWLDEHQEDGGAWMKSQRGTYDWKRALNVISGQNLDPVPEYRSQVNTNRLKRNIREIIATLSRLRPIWGYSSDNDGFKTQADQMNKVTRALYLEQMFDRSIHDALGWAAVTGSGFIWPCYTRGMAGRDRGNITLRALGAPCVYPSQLPSDGNFQQAYAVTIADGMPVYQAHGLFPDYQEYLRPTSSSYWYSDSANKSALSGAMNWFRRTFSSAGATSTSPDMMEVMVPIRYTYVIDLSVNETSHEIPMGDPDAIWHYIVPYVGQDIPDGHGGMRKATINDARLYPNRRLLISGESCIMYDGPSTDWHGMLPLAQFRLDGWPWEPLGYSLARDGYDIQTTISKIERGVTDRIVAQNDLPLAFDINSMSLQQAKQLDPMQPRLRTGIDMSSGVTSPVVPAVPLEVYQVRPEQFTALQHFSDSMDAQYAINDIRALAQARMASGDIEKIIDANGPIITDMSRSMEAPMRDIGNMVKYLILEYYTTSRVMQYVGTDGISPETFDFQPDSLVPSHLPGESPTQDETGAISQSTFSRTHRAKVFADNLRFFITPNSLHEMHQMEMKLGLIQLRKAMVPIDSETIAEAWNIRNFGSIPGATVYEKYQNEQELQLMFAARMKAVSEGLQALGPMGAMLAAGGALPGSATPTKSAEGHPPTGQASPSLINKDGGNRQTITESHGGGKPV